jgi:hypothetical protein
MQLSRTPYSAFLPALLALAQRAFIRWEILHLLAWALVLQLFIG